MNKIFYVLYFVNYLYIPQFNITLILIEIIYKWNNNYYNIINFYKLFIFNEYGDLIFEIIIIINNIYYIN